MALEGIERMKQFFRSMGVPVTFREVGIDIDKDGRMLAQRIEAFEGQAPCMWTISHEVYTGVSLENKEGKRPSFSLTFSIFGQ